MTPEQKQQRIAEIEARQPERADWQYGKDIDFLLSLVKSQEAGGDEARECSCHKFIHLHDGNCSVHGFVHKQELPRPEWEYCPSCAGELDTGYECAECGRDWQSYVHDAALRIEMEIEQ